MFWVDVGSPNGLNFHRFSGTFAAEKTALSVIAWFEKRQIGSLLTTKRLACGSIFSERADKGGRCLEEHYGNPSVFN